MWGGKKDGKEDGIGPSAWHYCHICNQVFQLRYQLASHMKKSHAGHVPTNHNNGDAVESDDNSSIDNETELDPDPDPDLGPEIEVNSNSMEEEDDVVFVSEKSSNPEVFLTDPKSWPWLALPETPDPDLDLDLQASPIKEPEVEDLEILYTKEEFEDGDEIEIIDQTIPPPPSELNFPPPPEWIFCQCCGQNYLNLDAFSQHLPIQFEHPQINKIETRRKSPAKIKTEPHSSLRPAKNERQKTPVKLKRQNSPNKTNSPIHKTPPKVNEPPRVTSRRKSPIKVRESPDKEIEFLEFRHYPKRVRVPKVDASPPSPMSILPSAGVAPSPTKRKGGRPKVPKVKKPTKNFAKSNLVPTKQRQFAGKHKMVDYNRSLPVLKKRKVDKIQTIKIVPVAIPHPPLPSATVTSPAKGISRVTSPPKGQESSSRSSPIKTGILKLPPNFKLEKLIKSIQTKFKASLSQPVDTENATSTSKATSTSNSVPLPLAVEKVKSPLFNGAHFFYLTGNYKEARELMAYNLKTHTSRKVAYFGGRSEEVNCTLKYAKNVVYILGGQSGGQDGKATNELHIYDIAKRSWDIGQLPVMLSERCEFEAIITDNHLYAIGGDQRKPGGNWKNINCVERLLLRPPIQKRSPNWTWEHADFMMYRRQNFAVTCLNDKLYVCGGHAAQRSKPKAQAKATNSVECLDFTQENAKWQLETPLLTKRVGACAVATPDGLLYVLGGGTEFNEETTRRLQTTEIYNPTRKYFGWVYGPPMKKARQFFSAFVHDNAIYALGGDADKLNPTMEKFDLNTLTWSIVRQAKLDREGHYWSVAFKNQ